MMKGLNYPLLKTDHDKWLWVESVISGLRGHGLTWSEISRITGRSRTSFSHVKRGKNLPSARFVESVAQKCAIHGFPLNTEVWMSLPESQKESGLFILKKEHKYTPKKVSSKVPSTQASQYAYRFTLEVYDKKMLEEVWSEKGMVIVPAKIGAVERHSSKNESFASVWNSFYRMVQEAHKK